MAKIIAHILFIGLFLFSGHNSFSQVYSPQRTCLIKVYKSQIGVRELTGNNDGVDVEKYLKTVGLGKGYAWCAAFPKWCLLEVKCLEAKAINGMAASTDRPGHYVFKNGVFIKTALPGDVGCIYYKHLGRIGHAFFFNGLSGNGMMYTVEGNTNSQNSREGDGVYLRIRSVNSIYRISRWLND